VERPTYEGEVNAQVAEAKSRMGEDDLDELIRSHGTWTVEEDSPNGG
jgi:hypothetical protein